MFPRFSSAGTGGTSVCTCVCADAVDAKHARRANRTIHMSFLLEDKEFFSRCVCCCCSAGGEKGSSDGTVQLRRLNHTAGARLPFSPSPPGGTIMRPPVFFIVALPLRPRGRGALVPPPPA